MSQREINLTVAAGHAMPVRAPGDFIFCKAAARPVVVRINGQAITMRAGDKQRLLRTAGDPNKPAFTEFDLDNTGSQFPLAVQLVVGTGDYNSQIVSGELIVAPGLQTASGSYVVDSRYELPIDVLIRNIVVSTETAGTHLRDSPNPGWSGLLGGSVGALASDEKHLYMHGVQNATNKVVVIDPRTDEYRVQTIPSFGYPVNCAVGDTHGNIWLFGSSAAGSAVNVHIGRLRTADWTMVVSTNVFVSDSLIRHAAFINGRMYLVDGNRQVRRINFWNPSAPFTLGIDSIEDVPLDIPWNISDFIGDLVENKIYMRRSSNGAMFAFVEDASGELIDAPVGTIGPIGAIFNKYNLVCQLWSGGWKTYTWKTRSTYATGIAERNDGAFSTLIEPAEWNNITANASVYRWGNKYAIRGEFIRAILQLLTGSDNRYRADYLDYVHALDYIDARTGARRIVSAGGATFAALGISDAFDAVVPDRVRLTVREGLFI